MRKHDSTHTLASNRQISDIPWLPVSYPRRFENLPEFLSIRENPVSPSEKTKRRFNKMDILFILPMPYVGYSNITKVFAYFGALKNLRGLPIKTTAFMFLLTLPALLETALNTSHISPTYLLRNFAYWLLIPIAMKCGAAHKEKIEAAVRTVVILQTSALIALEITAQYLFRYSNGGQLAMRAFFLNNQIGDIFSLHGVFFRVQIKANIWILLAICYQLLVRKFLSRTQFSFSIFGLIIAGNLTFLITACLAYALHAIRNFGTLSRARRNTVAGIFIFIIVMLSLIPTLIPYVNSKFGTTTSSVGHRYELLGAYINQQNDVIGALFGHGIGTPFRATQGSAGVEYIEIQWLNITNQFGLAPTLIWLASTLAMARARGKRKFEFYLAYLLASSTNPYVFDMNHFLIALWISARPLP